MVRPTARVARAMLTNSGPDNRFKTIDMPNLKILLIVLTLSSTISLVNARGRMLEPCQRSSLWRRGYNSPVNRDDDGLNCGGYWHQWQVNKGKCGVCGDPWETTPRPNEKGGKYSNGIISRTYHTDDTHINIGIEVEKNKKGYFEFRLCPDVSDKNPVSQECLDRYPLDIIGHGKQYHPPSPGMVYLQVAMPTGVVCERCVLQWKWHTALHWGQCEDGTSKVGCGDQTEIYNCADISILPTSDNILTNEPKMSEVFDPESVISIKHAPFEITSKIVIPVTQPDAWMDDVVPSESPLGKSTTYSILIGKGDSYGVPISNRRRYQKKDMTSTNLERRQLITSKKRIDKGSSKNIELVTHDVINLPYIGHSTSVKNNVQSDNVLPTQNPGIFHHIKVLEPLQSQRFKRNVPSISKSESVAIQGTQQPVRSQTVTSQSSGTINALSPNVGGPSSSSSSGWKEIKADTNTLGSTNNAVNQGSAIPETKSTLSLMGSNVAYDTSVNDFTTGNLLSPGIKDIGIGNIADPALMYDPSLSQISNLQNPIPFVTMSPLDYYHQNMHLAGLSMFDSGIISQSATSNQQQGGFVDHVGTVSPWSEQTTESTPNAKPTTTVQDKTTSKPEPQTTQEATVTKAYAAVETLPTQSVPPTTTQSPWIETNQQMSTGQSWVTVAPSEQLLTQPVMLQGTVNVNTGWQNQAMLSDSSMWTNMLGTTARYGSFNTNQMGGWAEIPFSTYVPETTTTKGEVITTTTSTTKITSEKQITPEIIQESTGVVSGTGNLTSAVSVDSNVTETTKAVEPEPRKTSSLVGHMNVSSEGFVVEELPAKTTTTQPPPPQEIPVVSQAEVFNNYSTVDAAVTVPTRKALPEVATQPPTPATLVTENKIVVSSPNAETTMNFQTEKQVVVLPPKLETTQSVPVETKVITVPPQSETIVNVVPTQSETTLNVVPTQSETTLNVVPSQSQTTVNVVPTQSETTVKAVPTQSETTVNAQAQVVLPPKEETTVGVQTNNQVVILPPKADTPIDVHTVVSQSKESAQGIENEIRASMKEHTVSTLPVKGQQPSSEALLQNMYNVLQEIMQKVQMQTPRQRELATSGTTIRRINQGQSTSDQQIITSGSSQQIVPSGVNEQNVVKTFHDQHAATNSLSKQQFPVDVAVGGLEKQNVDSYVQPEKSLSTGMESGQQTLTIPGQSEQSVATNFQTGITSPPGYVDNTIPIIEKVKQITDIVQQPAKVIQTTTAAPTTILTTEVPTTTTEAPTTTTVTTTTTKPTTTEPPVIDAVGGPSMSFFSSMYGPITTPKTNTWNTVTTTTPSPLMWADTVQSSMLNAQSSADIMNLASQMQNPAAAANVAELLNAMNAQASINAQTSGSSTNVDQQMATMTSGSANTGFTSLTVPTDTVSEPLQMQVNDTQPDLSQLTEQMSISNADVANVGSQNSWDIAAGGMTHINWDAISQLSAGPASTNPEPSVAKPMTGMDALIEIMKSQGYIKPTSPRPTTTTTTTPAPTTTTTPIPTTTTPPPAPTPPPVIYYADHISSRDVDPISRAVVLKMVKQMAPTKQDLVTVLYATGGDLLNSLGIDPKHLRGAPHTALINIFPEFRRVLGLPRRKRPARTDYPYQPHGAMNRHRPGAVGRDPYHQATSLGQSQYHQTASGSQSQYHQASGSQSQYPQAAGTSQSQYPPAAGTSQSQYPPAAGTSQSQYPHSAGTSQNQYPQTAGTSQNQYPQAAGTSQNQYPQPAETSQSQYPPAAGTSQSQYPPAAGHSQSQYPQPAASGQNQYAQPYGQQAYPGQDQYAVPQPQASIQGAAQSYHSPRPTVDPIQRAMDAAMTKQVLQMLGLVPEPPDVPPNRRGRGGARGPVDPYAPRPQDPYAQPFGADPYADPYSPRGQGQADPFNPRGNPAMSPAWAGVLGLGPEPGDLPPGGAGAGAGGGAGAGAGKMAPGRRRAQMMDQMIEMMGL